MSDSDQLLSIFTNVEDFEIDQYVDEIIFKLLNDSKGSQKLLQLSTLLDSMVLQLSSQFELKFNELLESNSIISYSNNKSDDDKDHQESEGITRLQFQTTTLKYSMVSLLEDVQNTTKEVNVLSSVNGGDNMVNLLKLTEIKNKIEQTLEVFNQLKTIFGSSSEELKSFTSDEFNLAINELKALLLNQLNDPQNSQNEKLYKIINGLIDLKALFKGFVHFQPFYDDFVQTLQSKLPLQSRKT